MRRSSAAFFIALVALLAGCASPNSLSDPAPSGIPTPSTTESFGTPSGDNDLVIRYNDTELHIASMDAAVNLDPITDALPSIVADNLYVFVRPAGWTLSAMQFTGEPYECDERSLEPVQDDIGGGWWTIRPVGPAGTYTLQLSAGSGPGLPLGGEVGAAGAYVTLQTMTDRPLPPPAATIDVVAIENEPASVSLTITGLSDSPDSVSASVVLTGSGEQPVTSTPTPQDGDCAMTGDVSLYSELTDDEISSLGEAPYRYDIDLVLDGATYTATGTTPEDGALGTLSFTPALP